MITLVIDVFMAQGRAGGLHRDLASCCIVRVARRPGRRGARLLQPAALFPNRSPVPAALAARPPSHESASLDAAPALVRTPSACSAHSGAPQRQVIPVIAGCVEAPRAWVQQQARVARLPAEERGGHAQQRAHPSGTRQRAGVPQRRKRQASGVAQRGQGGHLCPHHLPSTT